MKRLISVFVLAAFTMVSTPTIASANVATGQKVFKKKFSQAFVGNKQRAFGNPKGNSGTKNYRLPGEFSSN